MALAHFGTHFGAACLRGYFNATLRSEWSVGESWTIGALCHIDAELDTHHADDYLVPLAHHTARIEAAQRKEEFLPLSSASPWNETIAELERVMRRLNYFPQQET